MAQTMHLHPKSQLPNTQRPVPSSTMLSESLAVSVNLIRSRWKTAAVVMLLILSATVTCADCATVEQDLHIVDNRSPEIDLFWYMGRGVRPIGRFGKRLSVSNNLQPAVNLLELLLSILRKKERLRSTLMQDPSDWLP